MASGSGVGRFRVLWLCASLCALVVLSSAAAASGGSPGRPANLRDPVDWSALARDRDAQLAQRKGLEARRARAGDRASRERSRHSYAGLSAPEALKVADDAHREVMGAPAWDPMPLRSGERVHRRLGENAAVVEDARGQRGIYESSLPMLSRTESGALAPTSLKLIHKGTALVPSNPIVATTIGGTLGDGTSFDGTGVRFQVEGDPSATAVETDDKAFFANTQRDTDVVVTPQPRGVETFFELRSVDSPEEHRLRFTLPDGAVLKAGQGGGVDIVRGDTQLATIAPPAAWDADGVEVKTSYEVAGDDVIVHVAHQGGDFAYPIVVDPQVYWDYRDWTTNSSLADTGWRFLTPYPSQFAPLQLYPTWYGRGDYIKTPRAWTHYNGGEWGSWDLWAPAGAYIFRTDFTNGHYDPSGSICLQEGLLGADGSPVRDSTFGYWDTHDGHWHATGTEESVCATVWNQWTWSFYFSPDNGTHVNFDPPAAGNGNIASWSLVAFAASDAYESVGFEGGALVGLGDRVNPYATFTGATDGAWVDQATVQVTGHDTGLGVNLLSVSSTSSDPQAMQGTCTYNGPPYAPIGTPPCPPTVGPIQLPTSQMAEGPQTIPVTVKVDRTPPTVKTTGTLSDRRNQMVPDGTYNLHVDATDGSSIPDAARRSGVVHVEVRLDGEVQQSNDQPCATDSCPLSLDWSVDTTELEGGNHTVDVLARDALGHEGTDHFVFTKSCCFAPATSSTWGGGTPTKFDDVTGDSLDDAVGRLPGGQMQVARSQGNGFGPVENWGQGPPTAEFQLGDVNGDGQSDLLWQDPLSGDLKVSLSTGGAFAAATTWGSSSPTDKVLFADLDGDNLIDAVRYDPVGGAINASYSDGTAFEPALTAGSWDTSYAFSLADVTGDGAADAVGRNAAGDIHVGVSDGGSFGAAASWGSSPPSAELRLADVNGDGLADGVTRDPATGAVAMGSSNGGGFDPSAALGTWSGATFDVGDVNGDGRLDLAGTTPLNNAIQVAGSTAKTPLGPAPDVTAPTGVDIEPDVIAPPPPAPPPPSGAVARAASSPPKGYPALGLEDENALTKLRSYSPPSQDTAAQTDHYYRRLREAGVTLVRINAYWGGIQNRVQGNGYAGGGGKFTWDSIDAAVNAATRNGLAIHMTFTGTAFPRTGSSSNTTASINECNATGNLNGIGCDSNGTKTPTGYNITSTRQSDFGEFVEQGVRRYTRSGTAVAIRVASFGIWNEPNLASWLRADDNGEVMPTDLYRSLYDKAYQGWRNAIASDPAHGLPPVQGTQILIGELSSGVRSAKRTAGSSGPCADTVHKCLWSPLDFLNAVVGTTTLRASGVALHPYQDWSPPYSQPARYNTQGTLLKGTRLDMSISRLGAFFRGYAKLCEPITNRKCTGNLRAPPGSAQTAGEPTNLPGLYLTEFGYQNQPAKLSDLGPHISKLRNRYWHTERTRLNWFVGTPEHKGALDLAAASQAQWMILYNALEATPPPPPAGPIHDYGLFGLYDATKPGDDIAGVRPYGKDKENAPTGFRTPQRRLAYCGIRGWAIQHSYFDPSADDPATPEVDDRRNRCPTMLSSAFDGD
jgi:hypothetical protein